MSSAGERTIRFGTAEPVEYVTVYTFTQFTILGKVRTLIWAYHHVCFYHVGSPLKLTIRPVDPTVENLTSAKIAPGTTRMAKPIGVDSQAPCDL